MISIGDKFECVDDSQRVPILFHITKGDILTIEKQHHVLPDLFQCTFFSHGRSTWLYTFELLTSAFVKINSQPTLPIGNQTPLGNYNLSTVDQNFCNELSLNDIPDGSLFEKKCECGSASIGLNHHSSWCPKHGE